MSYIFIVMIRRKHTENMLKISGKISLIISQYYKIEIFYHLFIIELIDSQPLKTDISCLYLFSEGKKLQINHCTKY